MRGADEAVPIVERGTSVEREDTVAPGLGNLARSSLEAQRCWARVPLRDRLLWVRRLRGRLALDASGLAHASRPLDLRGARESLFAEVLPLLDAAKFLESRAERILAPHRLGAWGRPLWLTGVSLEVHREALGRVLILGPSNYPLFLPGVQALQALAAGNSVLVKPGLGGTEAMERLRAHAVASGLDEGLFQVLPESPECVPAVLSGGVEKVILTGSAATGSAVLAALAPRGIPASMELSGCDALFVGPGADLELVARALAFSLEWNGSETCIATRRVFLRKDALLGLEPLLAAKVGAILPRAGRPESVRRAADRVREALDGGARLVVGGRMEEDSGEIGTAGGVPSMGGIGTAGGIPPMGRIGTSGGIGTAGGIGTGRAMLLPTVLADVRPEMAVAREDLFAPVVSILTVADDEEALAWADSSPYALGAALFGDPAWADGMISRIRAGVVAVNDVIVPTADPRLPFGGRGRSGFGVTRGAEGLLEMTNPKAIVRRKRGPHPHLESPDEGAEALLLDYLRAVHGPGPISRLRAAGSFLLGLGGRLRLTRLLWPARRFHPRSSTQRMRSPK